MGQTEKKPLSSEPDQKMAENKVTVIHKIGFKVWNVVLKYNLQQLLIQQDCEIWFVRFSMDKNQKIMALGNQIGRTYVWDMDVEEPSLIKHTLLSHPKVISIKTWWNLYIICFSVQLPSDKRVWAEMEAFSSLSATMELSGGDYQQNLLCVLFHFSHI